MKYIAVNKFEIIIILLTIMIFPFHTFVKAQDISQIPGRYLLKGVPEMAAGFEFGSDSTFRFFYIYGASDRSANGTYTINKDNDKDKIILHGTKAAGTDFMLVDKKQSGNGFTVRISDSNKIFVKDVVCFFINENNDTDIVRTNDKGIATSVMNDCKQIQLIHSYFPDKPTTIELTDGNNFFEFSLNPSLSEVVFDNTPVEIDTVNKNILHLENIYLFPGKVNFEKK